MLNVEDKLSEMAMELQIKNRELMKLQEQLYQEKRSHQNLLCDYEHVLGILSKTQAMKLDINSCVLA